MIYIIDQVEKEQDSTQLRNSRWKPIEPYIPIATKKIDEDVYIPTPKNGNKKEQQPSTSKSTLSESSTSSSDSSDSSDSTSSTSSGSLKKKTKVSKSSGSLETAEVTGVSESLQPTGLVELQANDDPCIRKSTKPKTVTGKRKKSGSDKDKSDTNKPKKHKK